MNLRLHNSAAYDFLEYDANLYNFDRLQQQKKKMFSRHKFERLTQNLMTTYSFYIFEGHYLCLQIEERF